MQIFIYKSKKILEVIENGKCIHRYPIGIGAVAEGHKQSEGDLKTPVGDYKICVKNPKSKYHLSLGLNYPNIDDAKNALKEQHISNEQFEKIKNAHLEGKRPPWDTPLGGEIYIHGELEKKDTSKGCILLHNSNIEVLFHSVALGTCVRILP